MIILILDGIYSIYGYPRNMVLYRTNLKEYKLSMRNINCPVQHKVCDCVANFLIEKHLPFNFVKTRDKPHFINFPLSFFFWQKHLPTIFIVIFTKFARRKTNKLFYIIILKVLFCSFSISISTS